LDVGSQLRAWPLEGSAGGFPAGAERVKGLIAERERLKQEISRLR
jgi:hypothetical protein